MGDEEKTFGRSMNIDIPRKTGANTGWPSIGAFSVDRSAERPSLFHFTRSVSIANDVLPFKKLSADRGTPNDNSDYQRKRAFSTYGSNDSGVSSPTPTDHATSSPFRRENYRRSNSISVTNPSLSGKYRQDSGHGEYFKFSFGKLFGEKEANSPEPKPLPQLKPKSPISQVNKDELVGWICETSLR